LNTAAKILRGEMVVVIGDGTFQSGRGLVGLPGHF
jgi:hypothetical protein